MQADPLLADLNSASAEQLVAVSGMSLDEARAIVRHRETYGPIESRQALERVLEAVRMRPEKEQNATGGPAVSEADSAEVATSLGSIKS
jgi:hypothetical protein